jgi:hypothetical protein
MKIYELPLTRNYVAKWTPVEAVREILQNAIDYGHGNLDYQTDEANGKIIVNSPDAFLEPRTLLLGATSKAEDKDSIGSFGEGYKIALLVLARDGVDCTVHNGPYIWRAGFKHSEMFGEEVLVIHQEEVGFDRRGVSFEISGLASGDFSTIESNTLQMQGDIGHFHRVEQGDILLDRPGRLYVNGLFICETALKFGYNVKPSCINLERDRQTVSGWDLQWLTKDMWNKTGLHAHVASMLEEGVKDVEYVRYNTPEIVKEACYKLFRSKHPGAVVATNQKELDELIAKGLRDVVIVNENFGSVIRSHTNYSTGIISTAAKTPTGEMREYFDKWNRSMSKSARAGFETLIKRSNDWTNKTK